MTKRGLYIKALVLLRERRVIIFFPKITTIHFSLRLLIITSSEITVQTLNNPYTLEEQELVRRCLRRDDRAQMRLYRKYVQAMYNTVVRMVPNKMDAEDIIQEVFVKVFQQLNKFRGESTLGAWIKRITVNTTLNFIRQRKEIKFMENEEWDRSNLLQEEKIIDPEFSMKQVHHAIKKLPDGCRVVLNLYLLEGYQHQEIASILKITESTSKTQYRRGKQLLANELRTLR